MNSHLLQAVLLVALSALANGQGTSRPDVPDKIKAPPGENVVLQAHASGSQIYVCAQDPDQKYGWTLKAPEAELHDRFDQIWPHWGKARGDRGGTTNC